MSFCPCLQNWKIFTSPLVPETKWSARMAMVMVFLAPILPIIFLKSMAPIFVSGAILISLTWMIENRRYVPFINASLALPILALLLYSAITLFWTLDQEVSSAKYLRLLLFFVPFICIFGIFQTFTKAQYGRILLLLSLGLLTGVVIYFFEYFTQNMLFHVFYDGDYKPRDVIQNKTLYMFFLMLLPTAYYCYRKSQNKHMLLMGGILIISVPILIWISMNSSMRVITFVTGLGIIASFYMRGLWMRYLVGGMIILTIFTAPIFAQSIRHMDGIMDSNLSNALKSRIEIWDFTARRAIEKPLFGWGIKSSPFIPPRGEYSVLYVTEEPIRHLHPHNGVLQIWLELGLVGIIIFIAFLAGMWRAIGRISNDNLMRFAALSLGVGFFYILPSFGIWQTWFMSTLSMFALGMVCVVHYFDEDKREYLYTDIDEDDERPITV
jgi:O-antigen ligase